MTTQTTVSFDQDRAEYVLKAFGMHVNQDGYIVNTDTGELITPVDDNEPITVDELGVIAGDKRVVRNVTDDIVAYAFDEHTTRPRKPR